jgi:alkylated DNA repair dioxygenase AlkB
MCDVGSPLKAADASFERLMSFWQEYRIKSCIPRALWRGNMFETTSRLGDLFGPDPPPGLVYVPDFITVEAEQGLVACLDAGDWSEELKRRVQHFGYRYDYRARRVTQDSDLGPLPNWLLPWAHRLNSVGLFEREPDQVIANEYQPGQGISAHVDCEPCFGPVIASLSLLSTCEMVFRNLDDNRKVSLILAPRSLVILSDAARYRWTHEIPARRSDFIGGFRHPRGRRVSLTFRTVLGG